MEENLGKEFNQDYFKELERFEVRVQIQNGVSAQKDVFSAFVDLDKVRVVVIGQDPYHGTGQANGSRFL